MKSKRIHFFIILLVGVIFLQILLMSRTPVAAALPPRPTATPAASPEVANAIGGLIELQVEGVAQDVWTLVQWQDAFGDWHDVDGWQGTLDEGNIKMWWVGEADLGTGPFRWVVLGEDDSTEISELFDLPSTPNEKVIVTVVLD